MPYVSTGELLDHLLQLRISLANDLIELHRSHASFLQLRERPSFLNRLMLAGTADQENPVIRMKPSHKAMHLLGRSERALIEYIEPLLSSISLLTTGDLLIW